MPSSVDFPASCYYKQSCIIHKNVLGLVYEMFSPKPLGPTTAKALSVSSIGSAGRTKTETLSPYFTSSVVIG